MSLSVPDFGSLASQQKTASDYAAAQTNLANRPDQAGPMGTTTWTQDPTTGKWTQNTNLVGAASTLFGSTLGWQQGLADKIVGGAPEATFGAQQNVIDAWNRLQQPGLQQQEASARARAAAMGGLGLGSAGHTAMEGSIADMYRKAGDTSITQGVNAWNELYKNQLAGYGANREAMSSLTGVRNSLNPNEWTSKFSKSADYTPQTIYGAGLDKFSSDLAKENADRAQMNQWITGASSLGSALGGWPGIKGAAGDIWNIGKDIYSGASSMFGGGGGDILNPDYDMFMFD